MTKRSVIRDHTGAEWDVEGGVATARKKGVLSNAEPRSHLVQEKQWESPQMRDVGGQRYQSDAPGTRSAYQKYGEKESHDWAIADAGIVLEMDGNTCRRAVVAMGAASPVLRRSKEAEAALTGKPINQDSARAAGKASMTNAMPLSMNAYKVQLFPVAVYRTILLAAGQMDRDPSAAG